MKAVRLARAPRAGFSLIELMVVIAIIAVLAVLTLRVVGGIMVGAKEKATLSTIKKIEGLLNQRMEAISHINVQPMVIADMAKAGNNRGLATVLAKKDVFRQYCPQHFGERNLGTSTAVPNAADPTESAELLYFFLTSSSASLPGYSAAGTDSFSTSEVADTDGDGLLEFVDAWRQPIRFYRWPTRLIRPTGLGGALDRVTANLLINGLPAVPPGGTSDPLNADSDDPLGLTSTYSYTDSGGVVHTFENDYHTVNTYHTPLIVSAGEDGLLGLFEPSNVLVGASPGYVNGVNATSSTLGYLALPDGTPEALNDNISNLNRRVGGR